MAKRKETEALERAVENVHLFTMHKLKSCLDDATRRASVLREMLKNATEADEVRICGTDLVAMEMLTEVLQERLVEAEGIGEEISHAIAPALGENVLT